MAKKKPTDSVREFAERYERRIAELEKQITESAGGTLTAEQVSKAVYEHSIHADCADADWQAIADELNAALGGGECRIAWRDESTDTADGREHDGAYFCTGCGKDLPYPLQEMWDDYHALVCDYGNKPPWNKEPFTHCPNCGRRVKR